MPENLYKFFPTDNPNTWELSDPSQDDQHSPNDDEHNGWNPVTHKKHKQYTFAQPQRQPENRNKTATNTNAIPLGQRKDKTQTFLDDMGINNPARPGPSQQYRTPSQRQQADDYRASQTDAHRSQPPPPPPPPPTNTARQTPPVSNA
jgi:hypothetical protein